jgi:hypothetical protein
VPSGNGPHWLPIKAALCKLIGILGDRDPPLAVPDPVATVVNHASLVAGLGVLLPAAGLTGDAVVVGVEAVGVGAVLLQQGLRLIVRQVGAVLVYELRLILRCLAARLLVILRRQGRLGAHLLGLLAGRVAVLTGLSGRGARLVAIDTGGFSGRAGIVARLPYALGVLPCVVPVLTGLLRSRASLVPLGASVGGSLPCGVARRGVTLGVGLVGDVLLPLCLGVRVVGTLLLGLDLRVIVAGGPVLLAGELVLLRGLLLASGRLRVGIDGALLLRGGLLVVGRRIVARCLARLRVGPGLLLAGQRGRCAAKQQPSAEPPRVRQLAGDLDAGGFDPSGSVVRFAPVEWAAFTAGVHDGEFS